MSLSNLTKKVNNNNSETNQEQGSAIVQNVQKVSEEADLQATQVSQSTQVSQAAQVKQVQNKVQQVQNKVQKTITQQKPQELEPITEEELNNDLDDRDDKYIYAVPINSNEINISTSVVSQTMEYEVVTNNDFELPVFRPDVITEVSDVDLDRYFVHYNSNVLPVSVVGIDTVAETIEGYDVLKYKDTVLINANKIVNQEHLKLVYDRIIEELKKGKLYQGSIVTEVDTEYGSVKTLLINYLAIKKLEKVLPDYTIRLHSVVDENGIIIDYIVTVSREL